MAPRSRRRRRGHADDQTAIGRAGKSRDGALQLAEVLGIDAERFDADRRRNRLDRADLVPVRPDVGVVDDRHPHQIGRDPLENLGPLRAGAEFGLAEAGHAAARPLQRRDQTRAHRIDDVEKHHRQSAARREQRLRRIAIGADQEFGRQLSQIGRVVPDATVVVARPADFDLEIAALVPALGFEPLDQRIETCQRLPVATLGVHQHADAAHALRRQGDVFGRRLRRGYGRRVGAQGQVEELPEENPARWPANSRQAAPLPRRPGAK